MHHPRSIVIISALIALALAPLLALGQVEIGNRHLVETERQVDSFTRIASDGSAEIRIHKSTRTRVLVSTDANLQKHVKVTTSGDTLSLSLEPGLPPVRFSKLVVDVYMPRLEGISLAGSGNALLLDSFNGKELSLTISGSGSINGSIRYDTVAAAITGSGSLTLSGDSHQVDVSIAGSGSFHGNRLTTDSASATLSGSGSISLDVKSTMDAVNSGSGSIGYTGNPIVRSRNVGSGTIQKSGR